MLFGMALEKLDSLMGPSFPWNASSRGGGGVVGVVESHGD